jgi:multidrug efflux pump subunit AcrA (membrane-fusion protein)
MFRSRRFWLGLVLIFIMAGAGGYYFYTNINVATAADEEPEVQTSIVRRGNITISATGAGTVIPAEEIALSFASGGTITELLVQVGDQVEAGDLLARIDDTDAQQALANAQLQLAQASLQTDPEAVERAIAVAQIAVEQAEINLASTQAELDELLNWAPDEAAVALAEANLEASQASYEAASARDAASGNSLTSSRISLEQAQRSLEDAHTAYETAFDPGREWELYMTEPSCQQGQGGNTPCTGTPLGVQMERERNLAENAVQRAEENLAIAQANYSLAVSNLSDNNAVSAQSGVINAEIALQNALTGPTEAEIEATRLRVQQAELSLRQAQLNLVAAEDNTQAEISRQQAELNLTAVQQSLEETSLLAPSDGTVMAITAHTGENASTGFITLADLAQPLLEVFLDESDLDKVGLDFEVEVVFDALPDEVFTGRVIRVDPQLSSVGGVTAVRAVVLLDESSFAKPQTMPVGLNATVEVIGGRTEGALLVPVEALRELSSGQYAVFVMEDGEPKLRMVEVGLMDFTFAEILSGVEQGEVVTTGIVQTQ